MKNEYSLLPALCSAKRCYTLQLQQFADGGADAGADSGEYSSTGRDAAAQGQKLAVAGKVEGSGRDKTAEFEKLIRGQYKDQFAARTQRIIDQRFRESRGAQELAKTLADHYGLTADDYKGIEQAAVQRSKVDADARREKVESMVQQYRERSAEQIYAQWQEEGRALQQQYPDFVMERELTDDTFTRLLRAGVPLRTAYEARHLDELLGGAMQYAADKAAAAAEMRVAARAARPAENGVTPSASSVMQPDVNALTLAQREQIERRVARGERIRF